MAAVALTLTGCVGRESGGVGGSSTVAAPPTATAEKTWDASQWVPTERIEPLLTTEAEKEAAQREQVERMAREAGTPELLQVRRIDWSSTTLESSQKIGECMAAAGFPVEVTPTGALRYPTPPESQKRAWNLAENTCAVKHPVDPAYAHDWTEPQLRLVYDYWDQYLIPCLEAQGLHVDTSSRPSKESFVTSFFTQDRHDWWPYSTTMVGVSEEREAQIAQTCPELPPQDVFWGTAP